MSDGAEQLVLDQDSPDPLWRQAADLIMHQISTGKIANGGRLPAERDLLAQLSISRVTLRRALQSLVEEGVLKPSHGRGWYVSADVPKEFPNTLESFSETAARLGLVPSSDVLRASEAPATLDEEKSSRYGFRAISMLEMLGESSMAVVPARNRPR